MSTAFVQMGAVLTLTAPSTGVTAGKLYLVAGMLVIAQTTAASGETFDGYTCGVMDTPKTSAQAWAVGIDVFLDTTNHVADSDASKGPRIGRVLAAAANPSDTGRVFLCCEVTTRMAQIIRGRGAPVSKNTAGPVTLTAAELLAGVITVDCGGAGRTYTLPTAALLVAAVPNAQVGDQVECTIINGSDAAEAITIAEGAGGTWDANFVAAKTIPQAYSRTLWLRLTNVTASAEAYVVYLA
jgi:predicted RecA/RadA family phage recombinase